MFYNIQRLFDCRGSENIHQQSADRWAILGEGNFWTGRAILDKRYFYPV